MANNIDNKDNNKPVAICDQSQIGVTKCDNHELAGNIEPLIKVIRGQQVMLDKREEGVSAVIYTQQISRQFQLDIDRHNAQYTPINIETFRLSHDRFLCIDDDVYHIGASIKDLGKKWFGFSKMEILTPDELVERINKG